VLIGLIVPGDTIVIVAATAVDSPAEFLALVVVVIVGALGGESVGFALGRFFGPRIRHSRLGRRLGEHNWRRAEYYVDRRGGIAVFVSRFLPVLHSLVPLTVGMSTMRYRRFIAWTLPACVLWSSAYVAVGALAAGSYRELAEKLHWAGFVFVGIIVLFLVAVLVTKKLLERSQARHWAHSGDCDSNTLEEAEE
jgi:membrane protein DedA with SNARE-associated domain